MSSRSFVAAFAALVALVSCSGDPKPKEGSAPASPDTVLGPNEVIDLQSCGSSLGEAASRGRRIEVLELIDACLPGCMARPTPASTATACGVGGEPPDVRLAEASVAWIESMRGRPGATKELEAIDAALGKLVVTFSVPASSARAPRSEIASESTPRIVVRIDGKKMFVGAAPAATIAGGQLTPLARPFPGEPSARSTLSKAADSLARRLEELQVPNAPKPGDDTGDDDDDDDDDGIGTGTKMSLDEGKMGTKQGSRKAGQYAMKDNNVSPELAGQAAREAARKAGILGVLRAQAAPLVIADAEASASKVAAVTLAFGESWLAIEHDGELRAHPVKLVAMGVDLALRIEIVGDRIVVSGQHSADIPGAGGAPDWEALASVVERTKAANRLTLDMTTETETKTVVRFLDLAKKLGADDIGVMGGDPSEPRAVLETLTATGSLDVEIVRRYVERHLPRSIQCYGQQLLVDPDLSGVVDVEFVIAPTGKTQRATTKHEGLDNDVATCIAAAFKAIYFPRPRSGGTVSVKASLRLSY